MIPPILHRVFLRPIGSGAGTAATAFPSAEAWWERFGALHPGWERRTWQDPLDPADFELGELFDRCTSAAQLADLIRLEVVWRHGGVYVDVDCEPVGSFEPLRCFDAFIGTEDGNHLTNAVFGARPGHPGIRACMDAIRDEGLVGSLLPANEATGPHLVTRVLARRDDVMRLPPDLFSAATAHSIVRHHRLGSWMDSPHGAKRRAQELRKRLRGGTRRRLVDGAGWVKARAAALPPVSETTHATNVGSNKLLVSTALGRPLVVFADDRSLTPDLVAHGTFDPGYIRFLRRAVRPGDHVVDAGANIGYFTVALADFCRPMGQVWAVEPDPDSFGMLTENIEMNRLHNVQAQRCALGAEPGDVEFLPNATFRGEARTRRAADAAGKAITVACHRLDELVPVVVPIRLVKIDVEGDEAAVLRGMEALLDQRMISIVDIEVMRANAGDRWSELCLSIRDLVARGAELYALDRLGRMAPISVERIIAKGHFPHVIATFVGAV